MDEFIPIPYHEYAGTLCLLPFLQKNLGLLALLPKSTNQQATQTILLPKPIKEQSTQTEPHREEQSTQTKKQTGLLWGYFS